MKTYSTIIRELREDNDKTQNDISRVLNTTQSYYSKYERGEHPLPIDHLIKLCLYYNISADYILGLTTEKRPIN